MRRIYRIFLIAFWPFLWLVVAGFWIGSYWTVIPLVNQPLPREEGYHTFILHPPRLQSWHGTLAIILNNDPTFYPPIAWTVPPQHPVSYGDDSYKLEPGDINLRFHRWGIRLEKSVVGVTYKAWTYGHGRSRRSGRDLVEFTSATRLVISYGYLLGLCVVATLFVHRKQLVKLTLSHRRRARGLCVVCGYDLRASPQRCPECGTPHDNPPRIDFSSRPG